MNAFSIRRFASMLLSAAPRAMVASLVLMVLSACVPFLYFRRRGWL